MGLALVVAGSAFAAFLSHSDAEAFRGIAEPVVAFLTMWTAYVYARNGGGFRRIVGIATVFLSSAALLVVAAWAGWDFLGPSPTGLPIASGGFATLRGTWGSPLAMFVPIALAVSLTLDNALCSAAWRGGCIRHPGLDLCRWEPWSLCCVPPRYCSRALVRGQSALLLVVCCHTWVGLLANAQLQWLCTSDSTALIRDHLPA